jgi:hypothetical protein
MPICIAGMHRSGTSLVAHTLKMCGLRLGEHEDLIPAAAANPDGYWEHRRFVEINEELLAMLGGDWATPATVPQPSSAQWTQNADLARVRKAAQKLCAGFAGDDAWGWKDPRNSITLPFWSGLVPGLKVVVSVRHPLEVAASLGRVDPNASIAAGVERWMTYYRRLLADAPMSARMFTHTGSFFCEPAAEIRRLAGFAGLAPGAEAIERCLGIIRPDLRRNRFTADEVADFDLPAEALELYGRMCEEAGWDETRARALSSTWAPAGAVAVEEFERLVAARSAHARRLVAADAKVVRLQEDFLRHIDGRDDDLLWAMQTGITVRGVIRDYRRLVDYRRMVRHVRRVVRDVVPAGTPMLVISRGDEELLVGPDAQYFPQGPGGGYAGYHPASSLAAIGHLEALRARGAGFLVVPSTELWWLDEYREFGRHVRSRYRMVLEDPWSCTIFALGDAGAGARTVVDEFREAMSECEQVLQREPAILDWGTGWRLESECPDRTVFAPPVDDHVLPYVDQSVDVIALPAASPERIREAERVASAAVIIFPGVTEMSRPLSIRWMTGGTGQLPSVSIIIRVPDANPDSSPMLRSLRETLPVRLNAQLVTNLDLGAAVARATGEILVFLEAGAVVLPDWLAPLLRLFRDRPQAGAAGGKVLGLDGRLEHGGGVISPAGSLRSIGDEEYVAGGPASDVVRQIDWCSPVLLATRRALFNELHGFDGAYPSWYAVADYCLRLRERGHDVLFQPDTAVIRVDATPKITDPPSAFVARWSTGEPVQ